LGDAGGGIITQQDAQESACDGEADAFGLGGGSELGLRVLAELDTKALGVLERLNAASQLGELFLELGEPLAVLAGVEVAECAVGLAVETLAGESALAGVVGDVAVSAEEDTGGAGEPFERRYDTHG
jgi:hypothetical protein